MVGPVLCRPARKETSMELATAQSRAPAGIDVHKKMLAVVVRRDENGMTSYEQRAFGTTKREVGHLVAYLEHHHVTEWRWNLRRSTGGRCGAGWNPISVCT
jgi:hypothetical protein